MSSIPADVIGEIIFKTYSYFPEFFAKNHTLFDVLAFIRYNGTFLSIISNATGLDKQVIETTLDVYFEVMQYLQPTTATPPINTMNSSLLCTPSVSNGLLTSFSVIPALLILLLLSCLNQRNRKVKLCGRTIERPGVCIPVNLVDSYENRFAFACAFGATTTKCLTILFLASYEEIFTPEFSKWITGPEVPSFTGIIWKIVAMFVIGIAYYPLFACMATDYKVTGYVIGFFYSALWIVFVAAEYIQCPQYVTLVFPGDGLAVEMPVFLCLFFLFLRYFVLLVKALYTRYRPNASPKDEENEWMTFYKYKYVLSLLQPVPKEHRSPSSFKERLKGKVYKWKPEFKYSTRVICTYFISFVGTYEILILFFIVGGSLYRIRENIPENDLVDVSDVREWLLIGTVSVFVSVGFTGIYIIALVANMLSWYRGHLLRLQRGEKNFLPIEIFNRKPSAITTATLKYSGYQVAYICWGATICVLTLTVVGFVIGQQIILPMVKGSLDSFVWTKLSNLWPAVLISLAFFAIQLILAKYAFLIDKDATLALDNRRLFHVATFFLFFFNIFLGVISCLKRIIIGAVLGVMFLGRTQKSVISRDYELMDPGFNSYVGYLLLEHTHANPVLVTFCQLLIKTLIDKQPSEHEEHVLYANHVEDVQGCSNSQVSIELNKKTLQYTNFRRARNRWHLLYTLHNNPSLQEHRRAEMFTQRSPFAAFQVMIQRGMVHMNRDMLNEEESGVQDCKL